MQDQIIQARNYGIDCDGFLKKGVLLVRRMNFLPNNLLIFHSWLFIP